jgi:hypothetical protein
LSNSPWMRGAPQSGFASAMVRTRFASSEPTGGRPVRPRRDFQVQKARKPCRCQRITVSGRTRCTASRHPAGGEPHPEGSIEVPELRSLRSATEQGKLLPERQVLEREVSAGPERRAQGAQQSEYEGHCAPWFACRSPIVQSRDRFGKRQRQGSRRAKVRPRRAAAASRRDCWRHGSRIEFTPAINSRSKGSAGIARSMCPRQAARARRPRR